MTQKLELNLAKPGDAPAKKLSLNLDKGESFKVRLSWGGDTDIDLHALVAVNTGNGAKVSSLDDILSIYNAQRVIDGGIQVGYLPRAADNTFSVYNGALVHSPDAQNGGADDGADDEYILINPAKLTLPANGTLEIPLLSLIHPQSSGKTFKDVQNARVIIENRAGEPLLDVSLTKQFADYIGVQMGSIVLDSTGSHFAPVGAGFNCDFNEVLGYFS